MVGKILGYGLLLSEDDVHKLQPKNLMPAFSFRHIKELYPIFWSKAQELAYGVEADMLTTPESTVVIADWASRASLDIVGSAGMGHEFNSLSNPTIEDVMKTYGSMIKQSRGAKLPGGIEDPAAPAMDAKVLDGIPRRLPGVVAHVRAHPVYGAQRGQGYEYSGPGQLGRG